MTQATYLRRYTDLPALIYLLREQKLTLLDPKSWDDSNDSYYLSLYKDKKNLKTVLALCFSQTTETYHHWRVFADGSAGVCIRFRRSKLLPAFNGFPGVRMGEVKYLKLKDVRSSVAVEELPFLKRYAFQHECEFRLIYESKAKHVPKLDVAIPLSSVEQITLSPWIHPAIGEHVKAAIRSIPECGNLKVVRSTLVGNDEWKELGEHAV